MSDNVQVVHCDVIEGPTNNNQITTTIKKSYVNVNDEFTTTIGTRHSVAII